MTEPDGPSHLPRFDTSEPGGELASWVVFSGTDIALAGQVSREDLGRKIGDLQLSGCCVEKRCRFGIGYRGSAHSQAVTGELASNLHVLHAARWRKVLP